MGLRVKEGCMNYHTGTTGITQECPRQKYGHCGLTFISQVRPRTNGKKRGDRHHQWCQELCPDREHGLEMII